MIRKPVSHLLGGVVLILLMAPAMADILLIEKVRERMLRDLPGNGMSMVEVERRYGQPLERRAAVGDPPISRWVYSDYSVFFEHQLVIESVLHHEAVAREAQAAQR